MKKRFLSMALALCMALTLLPMTVFATYGAQGVDKLTVKGVNAKGYLEDNRLPGSGNWTTVDTDAWQGKVPLNTVDAENPDLISVVEEATDYSIRAWLIPEQDFKDNFEGKDFSTDFSKCNDLDHLPLIGYGESLNEAKTIADGTLLIVGVQHHSDKKFSFYVAKIAVSSNHDTGITVYSNGDKTKTVTATGSVAASDDTDETWINIPDGTPKAGKTVDLSAVYIYEEVICPEGEDSVAINFEATDKYAYSVEMVIAKSLKDDVGQPVWGAFRHEKAVPFNNGDKLGLGEHHLIARVIAQDKSTVEYHVYKIRVVKNPADKEITDAAILQTSHAYGNGHDRADFDGEFVGGLTQEDPATLIAKVPNSNNYGPEKLTNIDLHLLIDGDYIVYEQERESIGSTVTYGDDKIYPVTPEDGKNWVEITDLDFSKDNVCFVKVVKTTQDSKPLKAESVRYYKLIVQRENNSNCADILSGLVIGDETYSGANLTKLDVTAAIDGLPGGEGNYLNPVKITAVLPNNSDKINSRDVWGFYQSSEIKVTVDDGATIQWLLAGVQTPQDENWEDSKALKEAKDFQWNPDGTRTWTIKWNDGSSLNLSKNRWAYFFVKAEDGHTTKVYELELTMAGVGSQAVITDVIPTNGSRDLKGYVTNGLDPKPSTDPKNPTEVEVLLPYGGAANQLSARFKYSAGAKLTYKTTSFAEATGVEKENIGIFRDGEAQYIKVVSQNKNATSYYKLTIKIVDLKVKDGARGEVDLSKKLFIVKDGEVTVSELKDMLSYVGTFKVKDAAKNEVFDSAKVGTGYTVEVGDVALTVIVLGDTNGDGLIVPSEASKVLDVYIGNSTLSEYGAIAADANQDGSITPADASAILGIYVK